MTGHLSKRMRSSPAESMDGHVFERDDEFQQLYGNLNRDPTTSLPGENPEAIIGNGELAGSENSAAMSSSPLEPDRPSIFAPQMVIMSQPHSPASAPLRTVTSPLLSAAPLAALAVSSSSTPSRRARFAEQGFSMLDSPLPQAEKDGDDPTTPINAESSLQGMEYATPAALTRLLASHSADPSADSRSPSYTLGNGNLVRRRRCIHESSL